MKRERHHGQTKMNSLPAAVRIVEVGPRDGLQSIELSIPTETKIQFINKLSEADLNEIEVTSFVSPEWVPQLADAKKVSSSIKHFENIRYTALVPNLKGLEEALDSGYKSVAVFTTISETFCSKNTNCTIHESLDRIEEMSSIIRENNIRFRAYISTVWVCPFEGSIGPDKAIPVIRSLFDMGVEEISLGDTIGKATKEDVKTTLDTLINEFGVESFALHFHDTYGNALDNIRIGLDYGISTFDASAGGIGGCPYAPGASGNVSTNSVVDLCNRLEITTGINVKKLQEAASIIQSYVTHK